MFNLDMYFSAPDNFDFRNTIYSHGWSELLPFSIDEEIWSLSYVFNDETFNHPIFATLSATGNKINIDFADEVIQKAEKEIIKRKVKHVLRLDENLTKFYKLTKQNDDFKWIEANNVGRLMRSPTVFEDLIKTLCTTNCSWGLTKNMVKNMVEKLGIESNNGTKAFPDVEAFAKKDEKFYREEIRAGYRSPYFVELAESVVTGKINPETWLDSELPTNELKKEMKKIKGVGDYAAENLLKLVGRYDGLALDSFLRSEFYKKHNNGVTCADQEIIKFYEQFGEFRGLAIWFDMTKRWSE